MVKEEYVPKHVSYYLDKLMSAKGLNKSKLAKKLDISPSTVTRLLSGELPLNYEIAFKLEKLDNNKTCYTWMNYQIKYTIHNLRITQRKLHAKNAIFSS